MKLLTIAIIIVSLSFLFGFLNFNGADASGKSKSIYDYSAISIEGDEIKFEKYKGKKIIIVNVASKCGYTYQYEGLQDLSKKYENEVVVLGFPSNDFLRQEPGSNKEIKQFCSTEYGVDFSIFEKTVVKKNKNQHPVYTWLSHSTLNGWNDKSPSWNFYKYLINENGELVHFFNSSIKPLDKEILDFINN